MLGERYVGLLEHKNLRESNEISGWAIRNNSKMVLIQFLKLLKT